MIKAYDKEPYPFKGINTGSDMAMISGETVEEIRISSTVSPEIIAISEPVLIPLNG